MTILHRFGAGTDEALSIANLLIDKLRADLEAAKAVVEAVRAWEKWQPGDRPVPPSLKVVLAAYDARGK